MSLSEPTPGSEPIRSTSPSRSLEIRVVLDRLIRVSLTMLTQPAMSKGPPENMTGKSTIGSGANLLLGRPLEAVRWRMLDQLTVSDFIGHVSRTFRVPLDSGEVVELELIEADTIGESRRPASPGIRAQAFSLIFRGPRDRLLPQQIYAIEHPTRGTLGIFLVPLGPDGDSNGLHYQAIFN